MQTLNTWSSCLSLQPGYRLFLVALFYAIWPSLYWSHTQLIGTIKFLSAVLLWLAICFICCLPHFLHSLGFIKHLSSHFITYLQLSLLFWEGLQYLTQYVGLPLNGITLFRMQNHSAELASVPCRLHAIVVNHFTSLCGTEATSVLSCLCKQPFLLRRRTDEA